MTNQNTKVLTFKLAGDGPEHDAFCKGAGDKQRIVEHGINGMGKARLFDPDGSSDGVEIFKFSEVRVSNIFGFVVQKIQKETPSKDVDVEIAANVADMILNYHKVNPEKRYRLILAPKEGLF